MGALRTFSSMNNSFRGKMCMWWMGRHMSLTECSQQRVPNGSSPFTDKLRKKKHLMFLGTAGAERRWGGKYPWHCEMCHSLETWQISLPTEAALWQWSSCYSICMGLLEREPMGTDNHSLSCYLSTGYQCSVSVPWLPASAHCNIWSSVMAGSSWTETLPFWKPENILWLAFDFE